MWSGVIWGRSGVILECRITVCYKTFCQILNRLNASVVSKPLQNTLSPPRLCPPSPQPRHPWRSCRPTLLPGVEPLFEQLEESCCFVAIQNNIGQLEQDWSWNWDLIYFYFRLHPFSEKKRLLQTFTFYMGSFTFYRQEFTTLYISWKCISYINIKRQNTQTKNIWRLRGNI